MAERGWEPPAELSRAEIVAASERILRRPDLPLKEREDIFRIRVAELDWDIGGKVYEPADPTQIPRGADGKRVGCFLLHGGGGDHRGMEPLARLLAGKLGYKVATMTYPGNLYLLDPSHDWPGDTINPDGTARTPMWTVDRPITPDQYEIVEDRSDPQLRAKYGTIIFLQAKEGTEFYARMGAWPWAFEEAMKTVCQRNFPVEEYSIYAHGHSTGGPFVHMLLQRVENIAGLIGIESTPFGYINSQFGKQGWPFPFNRLMVRTWRDVARYAGPEAGPEGMQRLPWLMEEVFEAWEQRKRMPCIKSEHFVTFAGTTGLEQAARETAKRLGFDAEETEALVKRYVGYPRELSGPDVKPVPPLLYGITAGSRDHTWDRYRDILLPALAAMKPAPKACVVRYDAGVHGYMRPEPDLPKGVGPAAVSIWDEAIRNGYYLA